MTELESVLKAIEFHKDRANRKQAQLDDIRSIVEPLMYESHASFTTTFKLNILEEIMQILER